MTPKSLLRLPQATSHLEDLASGRFRPVLAEPGVDPEQVTRLILCSGKIYYDLVGHADRRQRPEIAIGRAELLYPFPQAEILELVESYPRLKEVVWVQEEPRNMGARTHMSPRLLQILPETSTSATSGGLSGPPRARGIRSPTLRNRTGSCPPRSISGSPSRSTRASRRASARRGRVAFGTLSGWGSAEMGRAATIRAVT